MKLLSAIVFFLTLAACTAFAQVTTSYRKTVVQLSDTVVLDTLSLVFGSVNISDMQGNPLNGSCIRVDHVNARLIVCGKMTGESVVVEYRMMPFRMNKSYAHKQRNQFLARDGMPARTEDVFVYTRDNQNFFNDTELTRKGSISRGVSFGNNQDAIVNSHLNLQLSGKLNNEIEITAAISDNNIPIQPDGNSQQLQEFDKVFINVRGGRFNITAGDFEDKAQGSYFLKYNKKAQGARFGINEVPLFRGVKLSSEVAGSVSKGKYRRQQFQGSEGVQGPYKLTGANGEMYIIILAGTEKIYIDGVLMMRGMENDYVIDYNTGELTFTARRPVTKDKRIVAEFEYSDRNYTRFLVTSQHNLQTEHGQFWLNLYSEQDNKNQAYDVTLTRADKLLLAEAGDNSVAAVRPNIDSVGFSAGEIRYAMVDTLIDGLVYDSVFVYSIDPAVAVYRLGFSYVGSGNGNYVKSITAANGRVFEWIAPSGAVKQGDYEPVVLLVSPKKHQALALGGSYALGGKTLLSAETAFSNNDLNTFSAKDAGDDYGMAGRLNFDRKLIDRPGSKLNMNLGYQFIHRNFGEIENFREQEFARDWNLGSASLSTGEHQAKFAMKYEHKSKSFADYQFAMMQRPGQYQGMRNQAQGVLNYGAWQLSGNASYLQAADTAVNSGFLRHRAGLSRQFGKFQLGLSEEAEDNRRFSLLNDSLVQGSFSWNSYRAWIGSADSAAQQFRLSYARRSDRVVADGVLANSTGAHDIDFSLKLADGQRQNLQASANYRKLSVFDASPGLVLPENNLTGRLEYSLRMLKGALHATTFYEIGSALERKTEFAYIEVAAGQGVYTWTDYNGNGVQELDEFEVAFFQDQANFIRYYTTTNDYIKAYANQFSQMLQFRPSNRWRNAKGFGGFLTRFSDQFAYKVNTKNTSDVFGVYANPFAGTNSDSSLVSLNSHVRNEFSFNKSNPAFSMDYVLSNNRSKMLLVNGFDNRNTLRHELITRFSLKSRFQCSNQFAGGTRSYDSEYFSTKNYIIDFLEDVFSFSFQPNMQHRFTLGYTWKNKQNRTGGEHLSAHDAGLEYRMSSVKRGSLGVNLNYIFIDYTGNSNSAVSYEMLEGLLPGSNLTWQVNFQRQLANGLQVSLNYSGRAAKDAKTIHTGGVQLRAFF